MPQYQIVFTDTCSYTSVYETLSDGARAAERLKDAISRYGHLDYKWRIRRLRDDGLPEDWQEREQARFDNGTYRPVPWADEEWYQPFANEHFCYLSLKEPGKIAYTENPQKGESDRQTIIGAGRYLTRYFKDKLDAAEIERLACLVSVEADACGLKVTQDADEIETVYINGPRSCMSGEADDYYGPCHPARVYAGPDLGIAYTGAKEKASGRCVVWPEKKLYGRIYGDAVRMGMLLEEAGYRFGEFDGARIRSIPCGDDFVMPFIDGRRRVDYDGRFIVLRDGDIECDRTDGLGGSGPQCDRCGDVMDEDSRHWIDEIDEYWCERCTANYATYCERRGEYLLDSQHSFGEVYFLQRVLNFRLANLRNISVYDLPVSERYIEVVTCGTAATDHPDVIYVEDRGEYWTQDALDLQAKLDRSDRARRGWETRRRNRQLVLAA